MQNSRRTFIKNSIVGASALGVAPLLSACSSREQQLTILHTNDVHSQIDPFPASHSRWPSQGGFARRAQLINQIRQQNEHVLLFDCGDIFQGTPYFNIYKGKLEIELMSKMGYDAATLGNHEFDNGIEALSDQVKRARFPFVCSNYKFEDTPMEGLTIPSKIITKGAIKVGIIGLGIELNGLVNTTAFKKTQCLDAVEIANQTAAQLKKDGCDLIVVLSHLGYKYNDDRVSDVVVAQNSSDIDIILGGHTHTFMEQPDRVLNKSKKEVIVNQAGWGGINLGRLDLKMNKAKTSAAVINSIYHV